MSDSESVELSSDVLLQLRVQGRILRVGQVCDNVLYLRDVEPSPPTEAELLITVNAKTAVHSIYLHQGIDADSEVVQFF